MDQTKKKLALLGNGYLSGIVVEAYNMGLLEDYKLTGILGRTKEKTEALAAKAGCRACSTIEELMEDKPDYVAEAASVKSIKDYAKTILCQGASLVVLSIGAFADQEFYEQAKNCAMEHGTRIYLASGAVGGFDVLRTTSLMALAQKMKAEGLSASEAGSLDGYLTAGISTRKGPASLMGTPVFKDYFMTDPEEAAVFSGSAKEAIGLLPTKVNVAVASSLATAGPDETTVDITSVPGMAGDDHKITAKIGGPDEVEAVVDIYSRTSAIAGWSTVAVLRNILSPVVF